ncbi:MAG: hypothetical protein ABJB86_04055 [Bacteroidota bacterium]
MKIRILNITKEQRIFLNGIFKQMIEEQQTDYGYEDDLLHHTGWHIAHIVYTFAFSIPPS